MTLYELMSLMFQLTGALIALFTLLISLIVFIAKKK